MPQERQFNPYTDNGGTILAISSKNFAVIAGDTRQSEGYSIQTRYAPKVTQLTDYCCIAVNGFAADGNELVKQIKQRLQWYNHIHACQPSVQSIARLIQTMLYAKRFFPYYVYVILAGIDHDGTGAVYSFDPVGSYERESCRAAGAAQSLVQPFLDNQEPTYEKGKSYTPPRADLPMEKVQALVIDAFTGAAERHIEVGDGLEIFIIEVGKGVQVVRRELKKD
ncbi:nucleophile aminohydrolase [Phakopsora pachyrhizi]|nr:nucleophile aminohydrolase [Phakopsora pachyrhizi]